MTGGRNISPVVSMMGILKLMGFLCSRIFRRWPSKTRQSSQSWRQSWKKSIANRTTREHFIQPGRPQIMEIEHKFAIKLIVDACLGKRRTNLTVSLEALMSKIAWFNFLRIYKRDIWRFAQVKTNNQGAVEEYTKWLFWALIQQLVEFMQLIVIWFKPQQSKNLS